MLVETERLITTELCSDISGGDITTNALSIGSCRSCISIKAREELVLAGLFASLSVFSRCDPSCVLVSSRTDGENIEANQEIAVLKGDVRSLLMAERTALNLLQIFSGIASYTSIFVDRLKGHKAKLLDTRKTLPSARHLSKYASWIGGALNHRFDLYDGILIKDNHIVSQGNNIRRAVKLAFASGYSKVAIECDNLRQAEEAAAAGANWLLLDNMPIESMAVYCSSKADNLIVEASGGISLDNLEEVAKTGVDYISSAKITLSAPSVDIGIDW